MVHCVYCNDDEEEEDWWMVHYVYGNHHEEGLTDTELVKQSVKLSLSDWLMILVEFRERRKDYDEKDCLEKRTKHHLFSPFS